MANILITKRTTIGTCLDYDIIRIRRENSIELLGNCFMHAFIENLPGLFQTYGPFTIFMSSLQMNPFICLLFLLSFTRSPKQKVPSFSSKQFKNLESNLELSSSQAYHHHYCHYCSTFLVIFVAQRTNSSLHDPLEGPQCLTLLLTLTVSHCSSYF